jgi:hypothetical protein
VPRGGHGVGIRPATGAVPIAPAGERLPPGMPARRPSASPTIGRIRPCTRLPTCCDYSRQAICVNGYNESGGAARGMPSASRHVTQTGGGR